MILIFVSIFGSMLFLLVFALFRSLLKTLGLRFIANWKFLDDFMICFGITGFFGGFLLMLLTFTVLQQNSMGGIRFIMIWLALFLCVFTFYLTNKPTLKKWYDEVVASSTLPQKAKSKKERRNAKPIRKVKGKKKS